MQTRKIRIKTTDPTEIIKELGLEFLEFEVEVPESSSVVKYLSKNENVLDWDYFEETKALETKAVDWNELARMVLGSIRIAQNSPYIIPGTDLWKTALIKEPEYNEANIVLTRMFLMSTYNDWKDSIEVEEDVIEKIKKHWKDLQEPLPLSSVLRLLWR